MMPHGGPAYFYTLADDYTPVPVRDPLAWAEWMTTHVTQIVLATTQIGELHVSTVFLGTRARQDAHDLFETLVIGHDDHHPLDHAQWQYDTYAEALAGHQTVLDLIVRSYPHGE